MDTCKELFDKIGQIKEISSNMKRDEIRLLSSSERPLPDDNTALDKFDLYWNTDVYLWKKLLTRKPIRQRRRAPIARSSCRIMQIFVKCVLLLALSNFELLLF